MPAEVVYQIEDIFHPRSIAQRERQGNVVKFLNYFEAAILNHCSGVIYLPFFSN
jgi:hypothetical protein